MSLKKDYKTSRSPDARKVRTEVVVAALVVILLIAGIVYVLLDLRESDLEVDNSNNVPISSTIVDDSLQYELYEIDDFQLEVPVGWQRVNNPEVIIDGQRYYPYRVQGVDQDQIGRRVDVYKNDIPGLIPITKLVNVSVVESMIVPDRLSGHCLSFTDVPQSELASDVQTEWNGHAFLCRPSGTFNIVAAVVNDVADGITLSNEKVTNTYLLVWQDHSQNEDNSIFFEILKTFKLR